MMIGVGQDTLKVKELVCDRERERFSLGNSKMSSVASDLKGKLGGSYIVGSWMDFDTM
jgi:hypothetical protein